MLEGKPVFQGSGEGVWELDCTLSSELAGASSTKAGSMSLFFAYMAVIALNGDGCPSQLPEGIRTWGGWGQVHGRGAAIHQVPPAQVTAATARCSLQAASCGGVGGGGYTALTWWPLQVCLLSLLLNLTSLGIIALILLTLIIYQDVFISCCSPS